MVSFADCSKGRLMLRPKLWLRPAPFLGGAHDTVAGAGDGHEIRAHASGRQKVLGGLEFGLSRTACGPIHTPRLCAPTGRGENTWLEARISFSVRLINFKSATRDLVVAQIERR